MLRKLDLLQAVEGQKQHKKGDAEQKQSDI